MRQRGIREKWVTKKEATIQDESRSVDVEIFHHQDDNSNLHIVKLSHQPVTSTPEKCESTGRPSSHYTNYVSPPPLQFDTKDEDIFETPEVIAASPVSQQGRHQHASSSSATLPTSQQQAASSAQPLLKPLNSCTPSPPKQFSSCTPSPPKELSSCTPTVETAVSSSVSSPQEEPLLTSPKHFIGHNIDLGFRMTGRKKYGCRGSQSTVKKLKANRRKKVEEWSPLKKFYFSAERPIPSSRIVRGKVKLFTPDENYMQPDDVSPSPSPTKDPKTTKPSRRLLFETTNLEQ
eukprot:TRINITY_DN3251_c0_g1_i3.p1 TRINITY_DN3251_c0_g1~~TRINITY_DN3251_c0_g1_i3.p1  ORF type:complete len:290 (-),score=69.77 TRINITY_DN3251_c0_g1_i3:762-1631(-)